MNINTLRFDKYSDGLIPTIAQDIETGQVLMIAGVNMEAVQKTIDTKLATWWSRSRDELWTKGLTSGDTLKVEGIRTDCDQDALLYLVRTEGSGACHKPGWKSCFGLELDENNSFEEKSEGWWKNFSSVLLDEETMLSDRNNPEKYSPGDSGTAKALQQDPMDRVAQKVGEEGLEIALAATDIEQDNSRVISETADLLYRLQILLIKNDIPWSDIEQEIVRRRS